jgi:hypothetical protein
MDAQIPLEGGPTLLWALGCFILLCICAFFWVADKVAEQRFDEGVQAQPGIPFRTREITKGSRQRPRREATNKKLAYDPI